MHTFSTVLNTSLRGPPLPQRMAKKDGRPNREGMSQTEFQRKNNLFSCILTFSDLLSAQTYGIFPIQIFSTTRGTCTKEDKPYKSQVSGKAVGPNPNLRKGPNDDLLL